MQVEPLALDGCYLISLDARRDTRGAFARFFCADTFSEHGLNTDWPQCNLSVTEQKGTLRGMHFQHAQAAETKLIRCVRGAVFDVLVDVRDGSPTFGKWVGTELSEDSFTMLYAAHGCAHGFQTLQDNTELMYFHSARYTPGAEGGVHHADPAIGIDWPLDVSICSERDAGLGTLSNIRSYA